VLGDVPESNGDFFAPLFGASITPNLHAAGAALVLLDNAYTNSEVSSTLGMANSSHSQ